MKRLGTLVMAIILLTGYNAIQPNMEETELLWRETENRIEAWALHIETNEQSNRNAPGHTGARVRNTPENTRTGRSPHTSIADINAIARTGKPDPTEPPQEEPAPTPQPVPTDPVVPSPEPTQRP